ncbi:MAG: hypothetical protein KBA26_06140 [Candidatus Delongbacteria bacterium]|nr:hypothetical protein [Candidatus Delongbacteria bacterium]
MPPIILGVAGNPVLHSRSPELFRHALDHYKIDGLYSRLLLRRIDELRPIMDGIGMTGLNITTPFKESVIPILDELDPMADRIGSVNLVLRRGDYWKGYNTDYWGALNDVRPYLEPNRCIKALVMGAGPAGRAAAAALADHGIEVWLANRNYAKALSAAPKIGCRAATLSDLPRITPQADILISALSPDVRLIQPEWIKSGSILLDANYRQSGFQTIPPDPRYRIIPGQEWLIHQAVPSFEHTTGHSVTADLMRRGLDHPSASSRIRRIALIGFMGCGKTTVARLTAERLHYDYIDLDSIIEEQAGQPIPQIFETYGEPEFRRLESAALSDVLRHDRIVIATGGGIVLDPSNRTLLSRHTMSTWLWAPLETCLDRISHYPDRPLLMNRSPEQIRHLYHSRIEAYARTADLIISGIPEADPTAGDLHHELYLAIHD